MKINLTHQFITIFIFSSRVTAPIPKRTKKTFRLFLKLEGKNAGTSQSISIELEAIGYSRTGTILLRWYLADGVLFP